MQAWPTSSKPVVVTSRAATACRKSITDKAAAQMDAPAGPPEDPEHAALARRSPQRHAPTRVVPPGSRPRPTRQGPSDSRSCRSPYFTTPVRATREQPEYAGRPASASYCASRLAISLASSVPAASSSARAWQETAELASPQRQ